MLHQQKHHRNTEAAVSVIAISASKLGRIVFETLPNYHRVVFLP